MPVEYWFPTPILHRDLSEDAQTPIKEELNAALAQLTFVPPAFSDDHGNLHLLTTADFQQNVIEQFDMGLFKGHIEDCLKEYVAPSTFAKGYKIVDSWFTRAPKDHHSIEHDHAPADVSGVYYLKTNGKDGRISFPNRNTIAKGVLFGEHFLRVDYPPKEGRMLMFPACQTHLVTKNTTDSDRTAIAFNITFNR